MGRYTAMVNEKWMMDIKYQIANWYNKLGILDKCCVNIDAAIDSQVAFVYDTIEDMASSHEVIALDIFNNEFEIPGYALSKDIKNEMLNIRYANPEIPLGKTLLKSDRRFIVIRHKSNPKKPVVVQDIPIDVAKFLLDPKNDFDESIFNHLILNNFKLEYNAIPIFKKILKIGHNDFKNKNLIITKDTDNEDDNKLDVVDYVIKKYNTVEASEFKNILDADMYQRLINIATLKNIHENTLMYRIYSGMSESEAIEIGIEEKEKYCIGNNLYNSITNTILRVVFFKVIREFIKENNKNE